MESNYSNDTTTHKKYVIAFDLDQSLMKGSTISIPIKKLLNKESIAIIKKLENESEYKTKNIAKLQEKIFKIIKENSNTTLQDLEKIIKEISLNTGFSELLSFIRENRSAFDSLIISGNNSIIVEWILEANGLADLFPVYYVHPAIADEECLIKVTECHQHDCDICDISQCKGRLLEAYINNNFPDRRNINVFFVGDGENDYCVGRFLRPEDTLFVRKGYDLDKIIQDKISKNQPNFDCEVCLWEDGHFILDKIKSRINFSSKF